MSPLCTHFEFDVTLGQLDHALVRHFELHLTQRVPLVIADGFVVVPEAQCVRECCLDKFLGALPRRLLVMRTDADLDRAGQSDRSPGFGGRLVG